MVKIIRSMIWTTSKARSAEASVAAERISSENREYSATMVINI